MVVIKGTPRSLRLRWKLFFTLLLFSLLPLLAMTISVRKTTKDVQDNLSQELWILLEQQIQQDLASLAKNYSYGLKQNGLLRETLLDSIVSATQNVLQHPVDNPAEGGRPVFAKDYSIEHRVPADLNPDRRYTTLAHKQSGTLSTTSGHVSLSKFAFYLPVQASAEDRAASHMLARHLVALEQELSELITDAELNVYRVHLAFENGLYATFPGHNDLASGYDARTKPWYRRAVRSDDVVWTSPLKDDATDRLVIALSIPLYDDAKNLIGVAAVDVLLEQELRGGEFLGSWSDEAAVMLALPGTKPSSDKAGLQLVAKANPQEGGIWHIGVEEQWLTFDKPAHEEKLLDAMDMFDVGTFAMPWNGVPSYWAWAPFRETSWFLVVLPISSTMQVPSMVANYQELTEVTRGRVVIASVFGVIIISMVVASIASSRITAPIRSMVGAAEQLAQGNFTARIEGHTGDERDRVIQAFNTMGPRLASHMETQKTLAIAQEVQARLLPDEAPEHPGWDISGASRYCEETGGDYFDFYHVVHGNEVGKKRLTVLVGDVSGHGIPSALLMTTTRALMRGRAACGAATIAERITSTNALLTKDTFGSGRFMTLFALELSPDTGNVWWVRAGHDPALCYCPESDSFIELGGKGLPLGVLPDSRYEGSHTTIPSGRILCIATDGLWETERGTAQQYDALGQVVSPVCKVTNEDAADGAALYAEQTGHVADGVHLTDSMAEASGNGTDDPVERCREEMYGKNRLSDCIRRNAHLSAEAIRDAIFADVEAWRGDRKPDDDVTLVIIKKV